MIEPIKTPVPVAGQSGQPTSGGTEGRTPPPADLQGTPPKTDEPAAPAEKASGELQTAFNDWTAQLTQRSFELSLSVIAANWAVFGGVNGILGSMLAKFSIAVVLIGLFLTLLGTWRMGELLRARFEYAEVDRQRWASECAVARQTADPWPYTGKIEELGKKLRVVKTFGPILGGALFIAALFPR